MRFLKLLLCTVCLLCFVTLPTRAATLDELYREQLEASGGQDLLNALPEETRRLMERLQLDLPDAPDGTADVNTWLELLGELVTAVMPESLAAGGSVLGILLLYAWVDGMRHTLRTEESASVFGAICTLSACAVVILPLSALITQVCRAMESVSVFMLSFIPVYGGILLCTGRPASALSFQSVVLCAAELLSYLSGTVIVPLLTVSLALGLVGSVTPELRLGRVGALIGKAAAWLLTLGMVLFTGILSLQSLTGGAADRLSDRAMRFSITHFVPVVGGTLSEAFGTVRGCLQVLRSTVGAFGVGATALIVLPPMLSCVLWNAVLTVGETAAELFGLTAFSELLKNAHGIVKCLIGVLAVSGLLLTVSLTVIALTVGGTT